MDLLPWHLQLKIYKDIGIDVYHKLNIKPGKLKVPPALKESITRCMHYKKSGLLYDSHCKKNEWYTEVIIHINNTTTNKQYRLCRRGNYEFIEWIVIGEYIEGDNGHYWTEKILLNT